MDCLTPSLTTAEVIAVGSELLGSTRLDTNSLFISSQLARLGIALETKSVVGDDRARLADVLEDALRRADLVILTGGLGPTDDDLTRDAVADVLGLELIEDPAITERIRRRFERRGLTMPEVNRRQAMVHRGAHSLPNPHGSAPGILIAIGGKLVVLLPGPPRELQPMLAALCSEGGAIAGRAGRTRLFTVSLFTTGLSESRVEELTQPIYSTWREAAEPISTTILATPGQVEIHLTMRSEDEAHANDVLERSRSQLAAAIGESAFSTDGRSLPHVVGGLLRERQLTFAAAESCTGGLLLQRMTDVPGSSEYVKGGVIAYSNELKVQLVGVDARLIDAYGAVSEPVAAAMVNGIRERTGADVCVSITGIAGPGGGSESKPVGTVIIGVLVPGQPLSVHTHQFPGGREMVRLQSSQMALDRVRRMLATEETRKETRKRI